MPSDSPLEQQILGILASRGLVSSADIQRITGTSQATVSRALTALSSRVLSFGRARATRYGLPKSIHGLPALQPLWWIGEDGGSTPIGSLCLLAQDIVQVESAWMTSSTRGALPWFLAPLRAEGFLGRLHAQALALPGIDANPERWGVETQLLAALRTGDAPGALVLGTPEPSVANTADAWLPMDASLGAELDTRAHDVAATLPAGSSVGGEQPKFLARRADGQHLLVKFTPPRGTPFGERWHDLLHAERLASQVLAEHGVEVARSHVIETSQRTYLLSERFDRMGARGRRHVVSVGAVHAAFVPDSYANWGMTCVALARQRRLDTQDAERATALLQFGRLIGNSDMHSGNLGLFVRAEDIAAGRFSLAPVYDMLPMRWRPDAALGGAPDYAPFEPDLASLGSAAAVPASAFWTKLAGHEAVSAALREVAAMMARRCTRA